MCIRDRSQTATAPSEEETAPAGDKIDVNSENDVARTVKPVSIDITATPVETASQGERRIPPSSDHRGRSSDEQQSSCQSDCTTSSETASDDNSGSESVSSPTVKSDSRRDSSYSRQ